MEECTKEITSEPPAPFPDETVARWMLDPQVTFLNHGCFGARLRAVSEAQAAWRERFESQPLVVLERGRDVDIDAAKAGVGEFLGMQPANFGFVTNATAAVNAVLGSLAFEAGDEVLTTNHVYPAVRQTMKHLLGRAGATPVEVAVPLPLASPDEVAGPLTGAMSDRTRLVIIDHVTSPTAVRFPVEHIVRACAERGVDVLVDGAHAPGMVDLDVESLGAAYYTGNLHKWVGAPPGAAFLWVRPDRRDEIHPAVISHFLGEGFAAEFAWQGTRDISPWLAAPVAIEAMSTLARPDGWQRIRAHNHELATWVQQTLCAAWGVAPNTPLDGSMLGSMAAVPVPDETRARSRTPDDINLALWRDHAIEVPVFEWCGRWLVRPSCQVYNRPEQYRRLAETLPTVSSPRTGG